MIMECFEIFLPLSKKSSSEKYIELIDIIIPNIIENYNKYILIGFEIMGVQAQDRSPNVEIKNGPSTSNKPLMVSLKGRRKTRAQLAPLKGWQPKEFVLGENTQSPLIRKVRYFPIITPQLSLINRFTIRKENILASERNIVSVKPRENPIF